MDNQGDTTSGIPATKVTRRSVLRAAGTVAAVGALGATGAVNAAGAVAAGDLAGTTEVGEEGSYDAIVIGAGYAGVTAARELRARGRRPLIIEARDRIGGRTWTQTFAGQRIELGANWFSPSQDLVMKELKRYGFGLSPEGVGPDKAVFPVEPGRYQEFGLDAFTHYDNLLARVFEGTRDYFPRPLEPLYAEDKIRAIDGKSLSDRMDDLKLPARDRLWISGTLSNYSGGNSADGALTALAQWWALPGHTTEGWHSLIGQVADDGMKGLLEAMLADARARVIYRQPVAYIADDGRRVTVVTRTGRIFRAPVAVVAVPANVWKHIRFAPGLPPMHAEVAEQGSGVPNAAKFWARVRGDVGRVVANGEEGAPISALFSYYDLGNSEQLMIGFSEDPSLDVSDPAQLNPVVRRMLPKAEVVDVRAQDWGKDEFARGGWALRRPGQLTRHLPAVQRPHGRIAFANDGIASGWTGFIDGAIETGFRAAEQAAALV
ncbi:flavin monoamine oxidase family protein [Streptomyces apocyni]|uniref:flavin monoamine oxidase family protein n=1 Tax=Streptomyces apocyni TaxID=2654677 RepID=UPI0012E9A0F8|nr:NAD(P)/FAD-dependent oxidoreductase [Streptomyces apocyni]